MDDSTSKNERDITGANENAAEGEAQGKAKQEPEVLDFVDDIGMVDGLPFDEVHRQISLSLRLADCHHRKAAFYLLQVELRRLFSLAGGNDTIHYCEIKHGLKRREAAELLAIGKMLDKLTATDQAFCDQEISWSKVRLLRRLLTEDNEAAWIQKAKNVNVRELARLVKLHKKGELPKTADQMKGTPEVRFAAHLVLDPDTHAKLAASQAKLGAELGRKATVLDVVKASVELYLQMENDGKAPGWTHVLSSLYRVHLYPPPRDDGGCDCGHDDCNAKDKQDEPVREGPLWVGTDEGLVPLDGNENDGLEAPHRSKMARDDGILVGKGEVIKDQPTPAALRTRVLDRDGGKCRCCNAKMRLHVHHLELRSMGGPTKQHNLGAVCSLCHALIHAGFIIIRGHNAETLRFEDRDGNPLSGPGETVPLKVLVRMELAFKRGKGFKVSADGTDEGAAATPLTLKLPDEVDTAWWQRNANRIQSRAARGLVYDPAAPLREEPDAAKDAAEEIQGDEHAFDKVVGRGELTERLEQQVRGCATLGRPMPHVLFTGPAGTGKTTIAKAIATRLGSRLVRKNGPDLNDVAALVRLLASLQKGDVLFVDEIHAVPRGVLEILYQAMDEQRLSLTFQEGAVEKPVVLTVSPFTLLAATTHPAKLPQPLRTRMGIREQLRRYEAEDLATLARMAAAAENFSLDEDAARILGGLSRGIPREVERLADTLVVAGAAQGRTALDVAFAKSVMAKEGFDTLGLRPVDRDVLEVLRGCVDENGKVGAPMGLERLAERTGTDRETVLREIEPELERLGLLRIGPGGRRITPRGIHWLRTRDGRPLDFKGFAARHTCGRSQRAAGDARLGSRRAD